MAKQYDVLIRLLILGDSGVGKTCLLRRFTENEYHPHHISTIGKLVKVFREHRWLCLSKNDITFLKDYSGVNKTVHALTLVVK